MHVGLQDTLSKIVAVWWPVFAFTAIGFEHSIANMFYVGKAMFMSVYTAEWHLFLPKCQELLMSTCLGFNIVLLLQYQCACPVAST